MSAQHDSHAEPATSASPSNLPLMALIAVIALWYAWGAGLVLLDVL
jgi:hypothetical protein